MVTASAFVGRIGALSVALGIGAVVVAAGSGTAAASPADVSGVDKGVGASTRDTASPAAEPESRSARASGNERVRGTVRAMSTRRTNSELAHAAEATSGGKGGVMSPAQVSPADRIPLATLSVLPADQSGASDGDLLGARVLTESPVVRSAAAARSAAGIDVVEALAPVLPGPSPSVPAVSPVAWMVLAATRRQIDPLLAANTTTVAFISSPGSPPLAAATAINQPPVIYKTELSAAVTSTGSVTGTVTASDPNGDVISYAATTSTKGSVSITTKGVFTYTPTAAARHAAAKVGAAPSETTDTVVVTATDAQGASTAATVTIRISATNRAPTATTTKAAPNTTTGLVSGSVNGADPDKDVLSYAVTLNPGKGTVTIDASTGAFNYTPAPAARHNAARSGATSAEKSDGFTVTVADGYGGSKAVAVTVPVNPINSAPVPGVAKVGTPNSSTGVVTGSVSATDADGDFLTFSGATTAKGTVVTAADGTFTYTPTAQARHAAASTSLSSSVRNDTFNITVSDGFGGTTRIPVTVSISPTNSIPERRNVIVGKPDPSTGVVTGVVDAVDADGDKLGYTGSSATAKGQVVVEANGAFTFTPSSTARKAATTATTDSFPVTVRDGYGGQLTVPVTVRILPLPTVQQSAPNTLTGAIIGSVKALNVTNGALVYAAPATTPKGTVSINSATGGFTFIPTPEARRNAVATGAAAADKTDNFTVTISDSQGEIQYAVLVTVNVR